MWVKYKTSIFEKSDGIRTFYVRIKIKKSKFPKVLVRQIFVFQMKERVLKWENMSSLGKFGQMEPLIPQLVEPYQRAQGTNYPPTAQKLYSFICAI